MGFRQNPVLHQGVAVPNLNSGQGVKSPLKCHGVCVGCLTSGSFSLSPIIELQEDHFTLQSVGFFFEVELRVSADHLS